MSGNHHYKKYKLNKLIASARTKKMKKLLKRHIDIIDSYIDSELDYIQGELFNKVDAKTIRDVDYIAFVLEGYCSDIEAVIKTQINEDENLIKVKEEAFEYLDEKLEENVSYFEGILEIIIDYYIDSIRKDVIEVIHPLIREYLIYDAKIGETEEEINETSFDYIKASVNLHHFQEDLLDIWGDIGNQKIIDYIVYESPYFILKDAVNRFKKTNSDLFDNYLEFHRGY